VPPTATDRPRSRSPGYFAVDDQGGGIVFEPPPRSSDHALIATLNSTKRAWRNGETGRLTFLPGFFTSPLGTDELDCAVQFQWLFEQAPRSYSCKTADSWKAMPALQEIVASTRVCSPLYLCLIS
jgi:hypothetical protein